MNFPRSLQFEGRRLLLSGNGRSPGGIAYLDVDRTVELFSGSVLQTGNLFSLIDVPDNQALPAVRVDHSAFHGSGVINVGDRLIVGPLTHGTHGPTARAAWPHGAVRTNGSSHVAGRDNRCLRSRGMIGQVASTGTFGRIIDDGGRLLFVHQNDFRSGQLRVGQRVSFVETDDGRGPKAIDVHAA